MAQHSPQYELEDVPPWQLECDWIDLFLLAPLEQRPPTVDDFAVAQPRTRRVLASFPQCMITYVAKRYLGNDQTNISRDAVITKLKYRLLRKYRVDKQRREPFDAAPKRSMSLSDSSASNSSSSPQVTTDGRSGGRDSTPPVRRAEPPVVETEPIVVKDGPTTVEVNVDVSDRMLRRISSVSLQAEGSGEDDASDSTGEDGNQTVNVVLSRVGDRVEMQDQVDRLMPLSCVTQEKLLHPRKRPPTSPAMLYMDAADSAQGFRGWKRRSRQASPASLHNFSHDTLVTRVPTRTVTSSMRPRNHFMQQIENESVGTLLLYQPTCLDHHNDTHQENRQRLSVLCGPEGVLRMERFKNLRWANLNELRPARLNDLMRVHTHQYLQHLEQSCAKLPPQNEEYTVGELYDDSYSLTYADWLASEKGQQVYAVENPPSSGSFDMDAPISSASYLAAKYAAGAVCHAIDKVMKKETRNAFVVVRPPGHHAGPNGCVDSEGFHRRPEMCTCGFCLLNNVAIGAAYAMCTYAPPYYTSTASPNKNSSSVQRIAIVDFDIHHGNGTEDIIRNLIPHKKRYPLPPSWGPLDFSSYMPWRDENDTDNVFFASIHLYDDDNFYPCSGSGPHGCSQELKDHPNIINMPMEVLGPRYLEDRLKISYKSKHALMEEASKTFRQNVSQRLIPSLRAFNPDLILISAGFDGHADDFYYFLSEDDYGWITEQIINVAEECCNGRIVSVLEGGYNVSPAHAQQKPARSKAKAANSNFHFAAKLHNREIDEELHGYGSLARSCAAHVTALLHAPNGPT